MICRISNKSLTRLLSVAMMPNVMMVSGVSDGTEGRKLDHLRIVLDEDVNA